jgi:hypothetical protein
VEGYIALMALFTALFAAPLALGSQIVLQGAGKTLVVLWLGLLLTLLLTSLLAGAVALYMMLD